MSKRCLVIPDAQVRPDRSIDHLGWAGDFVADKQFDIVIQIGDFGDFPSLSSYDKGKKSIENRRLSKDWDAFRRGMDKLMKPFERRKGYNPRLVYTEGNHEYRIKRYANDNPQVDTLPDVLGYMRSRGWEAYPYLEVARVEGVLVSHLFPRTLAGAVTNSSLKFGAKDAKTMIRANMASCIAGHKPGYDYGTHYVPGKQLHGLICGSFYLHNEEYNGPNMDSAWKGVFVCNQMKNGGFDPSPVRLSYLKERYK